MQYVKSFEKQENKNLLFKTFANNITRPPSYSWTSSLHTIQKEVYILSWNSQQPHTIVQTSSFSLMPTTLAPIESMCFPFEAHWLIQLEPMLHHQSLFVQNHNKQTNKHKIIIASMNLQNQLQKQPSREVSTLHLVILPTFAGSRKPYIQTLTNIPVSTQKSGIIQTIFQGFFFTPMSFEATITLGLIVNKCFSMKQILHNIVYLGFGIV